MTALASRLLFVLAALMVVLIAGRVSAQPFYLVCRGNAVTIICPDCIFRSKFE